MPRRKVFHRKPVFVLAFTGCENRLYTQIDARVSSRKSASECLILTIDRMRRIHASKACKALRPGNLKKLRNLRHISARIALRDLDVRARAAPYIYGVARAGCTTREAMSARLAIAAIIVAAAYKFSRRLAIASTPRHRRDAIDAKGDPRRHRAFDSRKGRGCRGHRRVHQV